MHEEGVLCVVSYLSKNQPTVEHTLHANWHTRSRYRGAICGLPIVNEVLSRNLETSWSWLGVKFHDSFIQVDSGVLNRSESLIIAAKLVLHENVLSGGTHMTIGVSVGMRISMISSY
jgi:hypothetical protein